MARHKPVSPKCSRSRLKKVPYDLAEHRRQVAAQQISNSKKCFKEAGTIDITELRMEAKDINCWSNSGVREVREAREDASALYQLFLESTEE